MAAPERTVVKSVGYTIMRRLIKAGPLNRAKEYIVSHKLKCSLVAGGILLAILVALYVWYSVVSWQSLGTRTDEVRSSVKATVTRLDQQSHEVEEISHAAKRMRADIDGLCEVSPLIRWHVRVVAPVDALQKECRTEQEKFRGTHHALVAIYDRAISEQEFAQSVTTTWQSLDELEPADHETRLSQWREARETLGAIKLHASLKSSRAAAVTAIDDIIASYESLVTASASEDRAAFDEAGDALRKSYSKLGAIQNHSVESYDGLIDNLKAATDKL